MENIQDICLERFSIEYRTTKTKVVTQAQNKGHRQHNEPIKTRSDYTKLTLIARKRGSFAIGFGFTSD